ncbi:MAG: hypothetical protein ACI8S6_004591, partial [Myxococcota bacterium]
MRLSVSLLQLHVAEHRSDVRLISFSFFMTSRGNAVSVP